MKATTDFPAGRSGMSAAMEGAHLASESVDFHCVRRMTMPMRTVLIILFIAIRAASASQEKSQDSYYVERYAGDLFR
jgi:hypothetical protein